MCIPSPKKMEAILTEYTTNKAIYSDLQHRVERAVQGRCCHHHVVILHILTKLFPISTYLELGVHNGTSMSYVVSQDRPIHCIGVDLFEETSSRYALDSLQQARTERNIQVMNSSQSKVSLIKGNTRASTTREAVVAALNGGQLDLLFIDGDHEYPGVESDFLLYSPLVSVGGLIVFDDAHAQYPGVLKCIQTRVEGSHKYRILGLFEGCDLIVQRLA